MTQVNCTRWATRIVVPVVAVLTLAACGQEDATTAGEPTGTASESAPGEEETSPSAEEESDSGQATGLPECAEVWVAEATFPEEYAGCVEDGEEAQEVRHRCSFGLPIIEHAGRYYAVPGGPVNDVGDTAASKQFRRALTNCQG